MLSGLLWAGRASSGRRSALHPRLCFGSVAPSCGTVCRRCFRELGCLCDSCSIPGCSVHREGWSWGFPRCNSAASPNHSVQWQRGTFMAFFSPRGINAYLVCNTNRGWVAGESFPILPAQAAVDVCALCIEGTESTQ